MSAAEPAANQSYGTFVWIPAPASPGTAVVGNPVANPVTNADIGNLGSGEVGGTVTTTLSQDITTMTNAVPHEFAGGMSSEQTPQTQQQRQPTQQQEQALNADPGTVVESVFEADEAVIEITPPQSSSLNVPTKFYVSSTAVPEDPLSAPSAAEKKKKDKAQRRRLSPAHREMIIDLVFNEKKTSREVARYMGLPQSTVMSVVQVFKKEHRIHKKTATGRKRRLTTDQEFQLFEMSQERENISVDEIRTRFLQQFPEFVHISKTTIYRTLERGKKGLIGMDPPMNADKMCDSREFYWGGSKKKSSKTPLKAITVSEQNSQGLEPNISLVEDASPIESTSEKDICRQRRSLSIAEREMIISLFFNENRTIREVADFLHLAKSTVSSVVQVFKKEHRIQRKTSTGRKKKLSDQHEQMIMNILSTKEDITIEETRSRFLNLNPEVPNISKSTIYRIMENCQSKMARSDMEVFVGTFVHSKEDTPMVILTDMVMGVLNSKIEILESVEELDQLKAEYGFTDSNIYYMSANEFMMPGLIDTHIHAPQFPNNGVALDLPLLEWLQKYTFPTEAYFTDTLFAREVYTKVVERLLRNGTTTAAYYSTIHLEGSKILADIVHGKGQRALIGKVNMVRNCPEYYREISVQESLRETEEFICYVKTLSQSLVLPVITPRFAPTCSEDQMAALGGLANKYNCHIQTHLAETQTEVSWAKDLFPWSKSYTDVYDKMRLLGEKTIMAHCVWLSDEELFTLRERGVGVAHCPNSNISLRSGLCNVRRLLSHGLKVGLGTDCSGGYSPSILDSIRHALSTSNILSFEREADGPGISFKEAFQMATLGGAKVLNMDDKIGNFDIDKEFDALLINTASPGSPIDIFEKDTIEDKIQKFIYCGDDRNIDRVYVAGKKIIDLHNKNVH